MSIQTDKTYLLLYKTTCIITNKFYFGIHSTNNIDDTYLGSGLILKRSIKKYGTANHTREILKIFNNVDELCLAEICIISEHIEDELCMNIAGGGQGGFIYAPMTQAIKDKISKAHIGKKMSDECRRNLSEKLKGRPRTEAHKESMRKPRHAGFGEIIRQENYKRWSDPEYKAKMSKINAKAHAVKYKLIDPSGKIYIFESSLPKIAAELNLSFRTLKTYLKLNLPVPQSKYSYPKLTEQRTNTTGWQVFKM